jgi:two-component system response regulator
MESKVTSHKVLVIDDSAVIRVRIREYLPQDKFEVIDAKNGLEGIEKIQSVNPNLIMLDWFLPKMSGWEIYQAIQRDDQLKTIPLVIMSGSKDEVVGNIPEEDFNYCAFVEKPFDPEELISAIQDAIRKRRPPVAPSITIDGLAKEITFLKKKITQLESEVARFKSLEGEVKHLKQQLTQLVAFIKKKFF